MAACKEKQEGPGVLWTASLTGELQTNGGSKEVDGLPKDDTEGCHLALHIPGHGDTHTHTHTDMYIHIHTHGRGREGARGI